MDPNNSRSGTLIFLECNFMLNATPVTHSFLSYTWLSNVSTSWLHLCFLFDNVLMKKYSLCDRCGDKKAFKETKLCGVIASKWILFIERFFLLSQKMNWVPYLPFSFYITNHKCINNLKTFRNLDNKFSIEIY